MMINNYRQGMTFIEVLITVAIGSMVLVALFSLAVRIFGLSREQIEQGGIVEEARTEMERMSDVMRSAHDIDFDGDGEFGGGVERWVQQASLNEIQVYSNIDADDESELVHYWLSGNNLMRGVTELSGGGEVSSILARSVRNIAKGQSLFTYYSLGGIKAVEVDPAYDVKSIDRVEMTLVIDVNENQLPAAVTVSTVATPERGYLKPAP